MLQILWVLVAGLVIGSIAKLVVPGRQDIPLWLTVLLGVVGALIGNFLSGLVGARHSGGFDWIRHALQVTAAAVLIAVVVPVWARRSPGRRGPLG